MARMGGCILVCIGAKGSAIELSRWYRPRNLVCWSMKMVDEQHLRRVKISARPRGQRAMAHALHLTYALPSKTHITIEGLENLPTDRGVMIALNHTDRYNYWPLQYELWRIGYERMTMAWVKAKYYENKVLG